MSAADFAAANLSRATGAGLDPHEYLRVTGELTDLDQWGEAFMRAAREHVARGERAATAISTGEHLQAAARWFHFATLGPNRRSALAAAEADTAMGQALELLEPQARRIEGPGFTGRLRGPADAAATVVVIPGLDSGKEEFHDVVTALLREEAARLAPRGRYLSVPHGDHLLGNARPDWLAMAAGWMAGALA